MRILVCISHVPDTTTKIKFTDGGQQLDTTGIQWIINPWDELALTRAVELKEDASTPVNEVVVINVGSSATEPTLRKCLAIGADKAIRIDTEPKDAYQTAYLLANFIEEEDFAFIVCGIESGDYNAASVGGMLAEILDFASISSVSSIRFEDNKPVYQRDVVNGKEELSVDGPVVLIVQKGFAHVPKIPNMRGIMMARKKPLEVKPAEDCEPLVSFLSFDTPPPKGKVKMIESDQSEDLIRLLQEEAKLL